jgi:hypothetical protein
MSFNSIHELIEKLQNFDGAIVGEGPKHPISPHSEMQGEIDNFISEYKFLLQDKGYIDFLECYSGMLIDSSDGRVFIDVFGFLEDVSLHLTRDESSIVDDGYFGFCTAVVRIECTGNLSKDDVGLGFAFDATGQKRWGVYCSINDENYEWYCSNFQEWMEKLVATKGYFVEPKAALIH